MKSDGNMSVYYSEDADKNRAYFLEKNEIDKDCCLLLKANNQDRIVLVDQEWISNQQSLYGKKVEADAVICTVPDVMLYLHFGDCLPFTVYDSKQRIFAFAHLGWKSIYLDLHDKIIDYMVQELHSSVSDLRVYIGPCIKSESYVFEDTIQAHDSRWQEHVYLLSDGYHVDLTGYVVAGLFRKGIVEEAIDVSAVDTAKDSHYFSNYRFTHTEGEKEGRFFYGSMMI